jgi:putative ABC transport system permease protein
MNLFGTLTREGLQSLSYNKLRSALTILGVIIGVGAVIVMVSIGEGAKRKVARNIQGLGTNLLVIRPELDRKGPVRAAAVQTLTLEDALAIGSEVDDAAAVAPEAGGQGQAKYLSKNWNTTILGTNERYLDVNNFRVREGRALEGDDVSGVRKVAVLGATPARELFGDASPLGQTIKVRGVNFDVVGVLEAKGQSGYRDPDDQILVPVTTAQKRLFGQPSLRAINVQVRTEDAMDRAEARIGALLRTRHRLQDGAPDDFNVRNQKEILATMSEVGDTFTALLAAVAAVSMLVGGIGIMNIMLVSVTERTREIGIRKAIGARQRDILFQFLVESVVLSLVGGLLGIALGVGASAIVGAGGTWETSIVGSSIALAFGVAVATGVVFGLYPARKASKLDPIVALRYE